MKEISWRAKKTPDPASVLSLSQSLRDLPEPLTRILLQRNISSFELARDFFRPSLEKLHDPFLMLDMDKAVARLIRAIENNEHIILYGDYDVDGTTAVSLCYSFLRNFYSNISFYIPDRYREGYGISFAGIDEAEKRNARLMITLDCGIRSVDKVAYAKEKGIDLIICDHHLPGNEIPDAVAILDPKRKDCTYPYKELSGCGVGFKLCQGLAIRQGYPLEKLFALLDLLCVSIASDIVEIRDENRILCYYGLKKLNEDPSIGIKALLHFYTRKKEYQISDIVFYLGPRINAAGRIKHATASVELLIEQDFDKALLLAEGLNKQNTERQSLDHNTTHEALSLIAGSEIHRLKKSTVLFGKEWSKGVVGIVASRLIEKYYKPTIVLAEHEGTITGSARSVHGFDIHAAIAACAPLLLHYGGHFYAAGLSLLPENLDTFIETFEKVVSETITDDSLLPMLEYDAEANFGNFDPRFMNVLQQMGPFGPGNMNPVFMTEKVKVLSDPHIVGNNHLKLFVEDHTGKRLGAIAFGYGDYYEKVKNGSYLNLCYHVEEYLYNGKRNVQLVIKDMKPAL